MFKRHSYESTAGYVMWLGVMSYFVVVVALSFIR